ncbi:MAG: hypothetical protein HY599_05140 [Candidatus Omnitrophica bacterium]|nr:hypothetical protein [Candidatus Omnitrophota bacterium]
MSQLIAPHGGTLVNRIVEGKERDALLANAAGLPRLELDPWALSDVEMIPPPAWGPPEAAPLRPRAYNRIRRSWPIASRQVVG